VYTFWSELPFTDAGVRLTDLLTEQMLADRVMTTSGMERPWRESVFAWFFWQTQKLIFRLSRPVII